MPCDAEVQHEFDDVLALPDEPDSAADSGPAGETATEAGAFERGKRRRRRRKKSAASRVEASEAALAEARERVESIEDRAFDADSDQLGGADDEDESDEARHSGEAEEKPIHRAIPTWKEAIDLVISVNMEARAKSPDRRPPHRSRGRGGRPE
ncbi:MAG: hypothetical protein NUV77_21260 [Thermoguttaceae bacterium]|nr:hypothetical protein [Thermoguttaceae bacterium]